MAPSGTDHDRCRHECNPGGKQNDEHRSCNRCVRCTEAIDHYQRDVAVGHAYVVSCRKGFMRRRLGRDAGQFGRADFRNFENDIRSRCRVTIQIESPALRRSRCGSPPSIGGSRARRRACAKRKQRQQQAPGFPALVTSPLRRRLTLDKIPAPLICPCQGVYQIGTSTRPGPPTHRVRRPSTAPP